MCLICAQWEQEKMTSKEAYRAISEVLTFSEDEEQRKHVQDLSEKILQKEVPQTENNYDLDGAWWQNTHRDEE